MTTSFNTSTKGLQTVVNTAARAKTSRKLAHTQYSFHNVYVHIYVHVYVIRYFPNNCIVVINYSTLYMLCIIIMYI